MGHYIYGIVHHAQLGLPADLAGVAGQPVQAFRRGAITAVISPLQARRIRPRRRDLQAHQRVLTELLDQTTPLPFAFGTVVDDPAALEALLDAHAETFASQLSRVSGRVEMTVKCRWDGDEDTLFPFLVQHDAELRGLRDELAQLGRPPSTDERITLGREVERALNDLRDGVRLSLVSAVTGCSSEVRPSDPKAQTDLAEVACLVSQDDLDAWDSALEAVAGQLPGDVVLSLSGPWAPYSFVDLALEN